MKKVSTLLTAVVLILTATTACKTTQTLEKTTPQATTTQSASVSYTALPLDMLNGKWLITEAMGHKVVGDEAVTILFDTATHRIYGNNGCNTFNGTLVTGKNCSLQFADCITTTKACRPEVTDTHVMNALNSTTHYNTLSHNKNEAKITLLDGKGNVVATLVRLMHDKLNGNWEVIEINGAKVQLEEKPTLIFDTDNMSIHGNSGCNMLNGGIDFDTTSHNRHMALVNVASTRRMCDPASMAVEDKLLSTLGKVNAFRIINDNCIALYAEPSAIDLIVLKRQ